ncbi:MAG TPA: sodium:proton antiporter NhaD [Xanthomonadales bacterium]|nr:sodium:proton antiporter NhaD [Xanthomonadales bacterium]
MATVAALLPGVAHASAATVPDLAWTSHPIGYVALAIFAIAYVFVVLEERLHLRKSKPVVLAAGLIWLLIAFGTMDEPELARAGFEEIFAEFAALFFFLVVAMCFVSAIAERNVFEAMRAELSSRGFSFRQLFWLTGLMGFLLSPVLDNLTTALVMAGVILAVGAGNARFVSIACINLVVAANAGGAWSAFGDITTLMVWQAQKVEFAEFFAIFVPSLVNWLVPALCMHFAVPAERPSVRPDDADIRYGGMAICALFAITIAITVLGKHYLHMPPVFGMMFGLGLLNLLAYWISLQEKAKPERRRDGQPDYSIFRIMANAEWDTLLFFYGVLLAVGGLAMLGYLGLASAALYEGLGPTWANVAMGTLSSIVDNIPIMYAVLQMDPPMDHGQWLLVTLTCGVGGSLLSVGSAAGVALMGQSKGQYTFMSHLRWTWAIALGYAASVAAHLWINARFFTGTAG